jgi:hypothetical protein
MFAGVKIMRPLAPAFHIKTTHHFFSNCTRPSALPSFPQKKERKKIYTAMHLTESGVLIVIEQSSCACEWDEYFFSLMPFFCLSRLKVRVLVDTSAVSIFCMRFNLALTLFLMLSLFFLSFLNPC